MIAQKPSYTIVEILRRRWTTASLTFLIIAIVAMAAVMLHKEKYAAVAHVLLVNDQSGRDPADAGLDLPTIVTSTAVLEDVRLRLRLNDTIPQLRRSIIARVAPRSRIMTLAAQNRNPQVAVNLLNAVADSLVQFYSKLSNARYGEVTRRLSRDLDHKRRLVIRLERELERSSSGATYVGSQASLDASAAHLGELEEARGAVYGQLAGDQKAFNSNRLEPQQLSGAIQHEKLMNNATYRESEIQISRDIAAYTVTRSGVNGSYPGIAGLQDKVRKEVAALHNMKEKALRRPDAYSPYAVGEVAAADKAAAAVSGDQARLESLDQQIAAAKISFATAPEKGPTIGAIRAEKDVAEAQYQALALRVTNAEANSAESSSLGQVVVVDRAVTAEPTLLGRPLLIALGLFAAALAAIVTAYLFEISFPRLIGSVDVERVYGQPTLVTLRSER